MKVGLVGLGRMGEGMSRRMLAAGIEVHGYRNNYSKDCRQYRNQFSNKNLNKCHYHIRFGKKAKNCEGPFCKMYLNFLKNKIFYFKQKPTTVNMPLYQEEMSENDTIECTREDKSKRIEVSNSCLTYEAVKKKIKQVSTKPKNKNSKFGKNNIFYDTKPDISNELLVVPDKKSKIP